MHVCLNDFTIVSIYLSIEHIRLYVCEPCNKEVSFPFTSRRLFFSYEFIWMFFHLKFAIRHSPVKLVFFQIFWSLTFRRTRNSHSLKQLNIMNCLRNAMVDLPLVLMSNVKDSKYLLIVPFIFVDCAVIFEALLSERNEFEFLHILSWSDFATVWGRTCPNFINLLYIYSSVGYWNWFIFNSFIEIILFNRMFWNICILNGLPRAWNSNGSFIGIF